MERTNRKRLKIELEVDGAQGRIELPNRDEPILVSALETNEVPLGLPRREESQQRLVDTARPYLHASIILDYEHGLRRLLQQLDQRDPCYLDVLTLQDRFAANEHSRGIYGATSEQSVEHSRIVENLNRIALLKVGTSFNELCQRGT